MKHTGIQLNKDYDLDIAVQRDGNGLIVAGLVIGDTAYQNQALLLMCQPGEFKESPTVGVGIGDIANDHDFALWRRAITEQLEADGMQINTLILTDKGLTLDAQYTD